VSKLICVDGNFVVMRAKKPKAKQKQTKIIKISQFKLTHHPPLAKN